MGVAAAAAGGVWGESYRRGVCAPTEGVRGATWGTVTPRIGRGCPRHRALCRTPANTGNGLFRSRQKTAMRARCGVAAAAGGGAVPLVSWLSEEEAPGGVGPAPGAYAKRQPWEAEALPELG